MSETHEAPISNYRNICQAGIMATALRDITDLVDKGVLVVANDGGRSTNFLLKADL